CMFYLLVINVGRFCWRNVEVWCVGCVSLARDGVVFVSLGMLAHRRSTAWVSRGVGESTKCGAVSRGAGGSMDGGAAFTECDRTRFIVELNQEFVRVEFYFYRYRGDTNLLNFRQKFGWLFQ